MSDGPEAMGCVVLGHAYTEWTYMPARAGGQRGWYRTCTRGTCTEIDMRYEDVAAPTERFIRRRHDVDVALQVWDELVDELHSVGLDRRQMALLVAMGSAMEGVRKQRAAELGGITVDPDVTGPRQVRDSFDAAGAGS